MWLALGLVLDNAMAHSPNYGTTSLSAVAGAPEELWANTEGWGLLHSTDGGASWGWLCEESVGAEGVYDVLAWAEGVALVATTSGLVRVGDDCTGTPVTGLDAGFVFRVAAWQGAAAVALVGPETGGLYRCDDASCVPMALVGAGYYPKSVVADGEALWVTLVHTETLAAELLYTVDGVEFEVRHAWPAGTVDPRIVLASGNTVGIWTRPRSDAALPAFELSTDGGTTFARTLEVGFYTDPTPGSLVLHGGETVFVGGYYGARTWRSSDGGASFAEVSETAPAVRCGLDLGDRALVCTDHLADGFDLAETRDGASFSPTTCLEEVGPAACAAEACEPYAAAWATAGAYGGGGCDPEADSGEPSAPAECGCGSRRASVGWLAVMAAIAFLRLPQHCRRVSRT